MNNLPKDVTPRLLGLILSLFDRLGQPSAGDWHHGLEGRGLKVIWSKKMIPDISAERTDFVVVPDPHPFKYDHDKEQRSVLLVPHDTAFKMLALGTLP